VPDDLDEEIDHWTRNHFRLYGDTYRLDWLNEPESERIAATAFGIEAG